MSEERIFERFVRHCGIDSITGDERAMADAVIAEIRDLGLEVTEDAVAAAAAAGAGNVLVRIDGRSEGWVMLCAHLDTVPHSEPIEVVESGGVFRSAGPTILGADNKAAVTVLCELACRAATEPPAVGVELLFTVAEEQGLRGAHAFDPASLRSEVGFVLDHASPVGEIAVGAPTYKHLRAEFSGVEAHAGLAPEQGRNAIDAAAAAIDSWELGRLDPETTANVGVIEGGSAPNVVPGSCAIEGEVRSVDAERATALVSEMIEGATWVAGERGCDVDCVVTERFRGYRLSGREPSVALAEAGLRRAGLEPSRVVTGGGSDANALRLAGFDAVLLANGTEAPHTPDESVSKEAILAMLAGCEAIVEEAAC